MPFDVNGSPTKVRCDGEVDNKSDESWRGESVEEESVLHRLQEAGTKNTDEESTHDGGNGEDPVRSPGGDVDVDGLAVHDKAIDVECVVTHCVCLCSLDEVGSKRGLK